VTTTFIAKSSSFDKLFRKNIPNLFDVFRNMVYSNGVVGNRTVTQTNERRTK
jgi:hypothetical protein